MNNEQRLRALRGKLTEITDQVQRDGRDRLTVDEHRRFEEIRAEITDIEDQIERSGRNNPDVVHVARAAARHDRKDWATRAAEAIWKANGEKRAVVASSIDIPSLVEPEVVPMNRPLRVIDLFVDRQQIGGNSFEYYKQTTRTNGAAVVADGSTKPTSTLTVTPVEDRCRVIAHLSEAISNRLLFDHQSLRSCLMPSCVRDCSMPLSPR
jgi:hypothetical protein